MEATTKQPPTLEELQERGPRVGDVIYIKADILSDEDEEHEIRSAGSDWVMFDRFVIQKADLRITTSTISNRAAWTLKDGILNSRLDHSNAINYITISPGYRNPPVSKSSARPQPKPLKDLDKSSAAPVSRTVEGISATAPVFRHLHPSDEALDNIRALERDKFSLVLTGEVGIKDTLFEDNSEAWKNEFGDDLLIMQDCAFTADGESTGMCMIFAPKPQKNTSTVKS